MSSYDSIAPDPLANSAVNTPGKRAVSTVKYFVPLTGFSFNVVRNGEDIEVSDLKNENTHKYMDEQTLAKANTIFTRLEEMEQCRKFLSYTPIPSRIEMSKPSNSGPLGSLDGIIIHHENLKKIIPGFIEVVESRIDELRKELSEL